LTVEKNEKRTKAAVESQNGLMSQLSNRKAPTVSDAGVDLFLEVFMPCAEHRQLLNEAANAEAALKSLSNLKVSNPNTVRDEDFHRLGGNVTNANYKVRMHVAACPECSKEDDATAG
jgi:hypothetical protein